jgi:site-specific recombinase XerD
MQQSPETVRAYTQDLRRWNEYKSQNPFPQVDKPTFELALGFRDWLSSTLSPASAARNWSTVRTYYRWLLAQGVVSSSPFDSIKGPKRTTNRTPVVPSDDDVDALVRAADANPKHACIVALLLNGLRAGEVGNLRVEDVLIPNRGSGGYHMRVTGKGQKERLVPMTDESVSALRRYWHEDKVANEWAIVNQYGEHLTNKAVADIIYDHKIKGMHPHALRHHYATRLVKAGVDLQHVRDMLGHTSVATTQVYVTLDLTDLIKASRLDPRNPIVSGLRAVEGAVA